MPGRPPRLSSQDLQRLRGDIAQPPAVFGFEQSRWSGKLLAEHLLNNYGAVLSVRQCRRILKAGGFEQPVRDQRVNSVQVSAQAVNDHPRPASPVSDMTRKDNALRKIKRLCSSGLPLFGLAQALFELMNDAIPQCDNRVLLPDDGTGRPGRYITSSVELAKWAAIHKQLVLEAPPETSGVVSLQSVLNGKLVWKREDFALPHFYRSAGYNECLRHMGFHHALLINLRDHLQLSGNYPLWRSADMDDFTPADVRFAQAASPYIAHAIAVANRIANDRDLDGFMPLSGSGQGVLIMDRNGRVTGMDTSARDICRMLNLFEHSRDIVSTQLNSAIDYIQSTLNSIRKRGEDPFADCRSPAACFHTHTSGLILKLRGVSVEKESGDPETVILIEVGEGSDHRRRRIMYRYGLTPRLMEVMVYVAANLGATEISQRMGISKFTVRDYVNYWSVWA